MAANLHSHNRRPYVAWGFLVLMQCGVRVDWVAALVNHLTLHTTGYIRFEEGVFGV